MQDLQKILNTYQYYSFKYLQQKIIITPKEEKLVKNHLSLGKEKLLEAIRLFYRYLTDFNYKNNNTTISTILNTFNPSLQLGKDWHFANEFYKFLKDDKRHFQKESKEYLLFLRQAQTEIKDKGYTKEQQVKLKEIWKISSFPKSLVDKSNIQKISLEALELIKNKGTITESQLVDIANKYIKPKLQEEQQAIQKFIEQTKQPQDPPPKVPTKKATKPDRSNKKTSQNSSTKNRKIDNVENAKDFREREKVPLQLLSRLCNAAPPKNVIKEAKKIWENKTDLTIKIEISYLSQNQLAGLDLDGEPSRETKTFTCKSFKEVADKIGRWGDNMFETSNYCINFKGYSAFFSSSSLSSTELPYMDDREQEEYIQSQREKEIARFLQREKEREKDTKYKILSIQREEQRKTKSLMPLIKWILIQNLTTIICNDLEVPEILENIKKIKDFEDFINKCSLFINSQKNRKKLLTYYFCLNEINSSYSEELTNLNQRVIIDFLEIYNKQADNRAIVPQYNKLRFENIGELNDSSKEYIIEKIFSFTSEVFNKEKILQKYQIKDFYELQKLQPHEKLEIVENLTEEERTFFIQANEFPERAKRDLVNNEENSKINKALREFKNYHLEIKAKDIEQGTKIAGDNIFGYNIHIPPKDRKKGEASYIRIRLSIPALYELISKLGYVSIIASQQIRAKTLPPEVMRLRRFIIPKYPRPDQHFKLQTAIDEMCPPERRKKYNPSGFYGRYDVLDQWLRTCFNFLLGYYEITPLNSFTTKFLNGKNKVTKNTPKAEVFHFQLIEK